MRTMMIEAEEHIEGHGLPRAETLEQVADACRASLTAHVLSGDISIETGQEMTRVLEAILREKLEAGPS